MTIENTRKSIVRWHEMLETRDMSILNELLAESVLNLCPSQAYTILLFAHT